MEQRILFNKRTILDIMPGQDRALKDAVDKYKPNRMLNTSTDDLVAYFTARFRLDAPVLLKDQTTVGQQETKIDVSRDPMRGVFDRSRPAYVPGTEIVMDIPFEGDAAFFDVQPRTFTFNPPYAVVKENVLHLVYHSPHDSQSAAAAKGAFDSQLREIESYLTSLHGDCSSYNNDLPGKTRSLIEARKKRMLDSANLTASLGYPMRHRDSASTYSAPEVRRKLPPAPPPASSAPFRPEPALPQEEYEYILNLITASMEVLERSPKAYTAMGEEDLRTQILVVLNFHYEGQATGETFNYTGKTDILVRSDRGNVFVAECKFWSGPAKFNETIDQLLGYVTWRDTKTAIVIFNRNKDFTAMQQVLVTSLPEHPYFKREVARSERTLRAVFSHPDDRNREVVITFLPFDVPVAT